jgi:hypothetical protein
MDKRHLNLKKHLNLAFHYMLLLVYISSLFLSGCATTPGSNKSVTNKSSGKNNSSLSTGTGGVSENYGFQEQGSSGVTGTSKTGDFFSFKLPFELSTIKLDNLSTKEKGIVAGVFGLTFAGVYAGLLITKIFFKKP